ncbi:MAG: flagellin [Pseudomonadota bacterium]
MAAIQVFSQAALAGGNRVNQVSSAINRQVGQLSSGTAIQTAADGAAALAIGSRIAGEVESLRTITANLGLAASQITAQDATIADIQDILLRLRALAVSASAANFSDAERALLDTEFQALLLEIDRQAKDLEIAGTPLTETDFKPIFFSDNFDDGTVPSDTFLRGTAAFNGGGAISLLEGSEGDNVTGALVNDTRFLTDGGLEASFRIQAGGTISGGANLYGGGFSFFLVDADQFNAAVDPLGGFSSTNLGYIGLTGGVIGIGFDSFGAFASPPTVRDTVAVRGPDSLGFPLLAPGFDLGPFGGLDGTTDVPPQPLLTRDITLSLDEDFKVSVDITIVETGTVVSVLSEFDLGALVPEANRPEAVKFGFAATVANRRNNFIIDDLEVAASLSAERRMEAAALTVKAATDIDPNLQLSLPRFDATLAGLTLDGQSIATQSAAETAIGRLVFAQEQTIEARSVLGAAMSRYLAASQNLATKTDFLEEARSGLLDLNVARAITELTNALAQQSAGISVVGQANETQASVADGLRGIIDGIVNGAGLSVRT